MKSTFMRMILLSFLLILFIPNLTFAETKTFIKEYTFQASDEDSKNSSRTISLREVKRLLLEELGTYLESITEVQNFQLTKDQITMLTAGIVQTEIIDEKWDGRTYWLKSKITADSGDVVKAIDSLRKDRQKTKELEDMRKRSDDLLKENERLRNELATATGEKKQKDTKAYNKTIKDLNAAEWFEIGFAAANSSNHTEAVAAFSKTIELNPQAVGAYNNRGAAYNNLGNYKQAIKDFDKAIKLNPKLAMAYVNRGAAYGGLGDYKQAIKDSNKAIAINPKLAEAYGNRGNAYERLGNLNQAIKDYDRAIELNPQDAISYNNRGNFYIIAIGNYNQAIKDLDVAIELNPQYPNAYWNRGYAYNSLGNLNQAIKDYDKAIELNPQAAHYFFSRGFAYFNLGNHNQAIKDFEMAIELNPRYPNYYFFRGGAYHSLGNINQAFSDYKIAARLGFKEAQDYLREQGIVW